MRALLFIGLLAIARFASAQDANVLFAQGSQEQALSAAAAALDREYPGGLRKPLGWSIGYAEQFGDPVSGILSVSIALYPFSAAQLGSAADISSFALVFNIKTDRGDPQTELASLKSAVLDLAPAAGLAPMRSHHDLSPLFQQAVTCQIRLKQDPDLSVIRDQVAMDPSDLKSAALLAAAGTPDQSQKAALRRWTKERNDCLANVLAARPYFLHTRFYAPIDKAYREIASLVRALYVGSITFGQFNSSVASLTDAMMAAIKTAAQADNHDQALFLGDHDAHDMTAFHPTQPVDITDDPRAILVDLPELPHTADSR